MSTIIINGTALGGHNTISIDSYLAGLIGAELIYLNELKIAQFRYDNSYPDSDQFDATMTKVILDYDSIVWSTPMYWYAMSGHIKVFLDRMTMLLKSNKDLGRKLRNKKMALIYNSNGKSVDYFPAPFIHTADYLGMNYLGDLHLNMESNNLTEEHKRQLKTFSSRFI